MELECRAPNQWLQRRGQLGRPRCASVTNQSRNDRNVPRQRRFDLKADRIGAIVQQSPPSSVRRQPIRSDDHQHDVGLPDRVGDGFSEAIVLRYGVDPQPNTGRVEPLAQQAMEATSVIGRVGDAIADKDGDVGSTGHGSHART